MDEVAGIDQPYAHASIARRRDHGAIELDLRGFDRRIVARHRGRELIDLALLQIEVLLGGEALVGERAQARQVLLSGEELRLVLALLGPSLIERRLEQARVDGGENVALVDTLPLGEPHVLQLAVDLAADRNAHGGLYGAEPAQINRHVAARGHSYSDHRSIRSGIALAALCLEIEIPVSCAAACEDQHHHSWPNGLAPAPFADLLVHLRSLQGPRQPGLGLDLGRFDAIPPKICVVHTPTQTRTPRIRNCDGYMFVELARRRHLRCPLPWGFGTPRQQLTRQHTTYRRRRKGSVGLLDLQQQRNLLLKVC